MVELMQRLCARSDDCHDRPPVGRQLLGIGDYYDRATSCAAIRDDFRIVYGYVEEELGSSAKPFEVLVIPA